MFWKYLELDKLCPPELLCFNHLYSEYLTMRLTMKPEDVEYVQNLELKVKSSDQTTGKEGDTSDWKGKGPKPVPLSWDELYCFELILASYIPYEKLRSKVVRLRSDYQSISTEKQYNDYLASKPPDLQSPPEHTDAKRSEYEKLLREDLKDLLSRIYMKYAVLPVREKRLTDLTMFAARLCLISLLILLTVLLVVFLLPFGAELYNTMKGDWDGSKLVSALSNVFTNSPVLASLTVFVVVISGAMGGFVSALQRIQSTTTEGDSIYNLSLLFHGSKSVFVAPITGAVFAMLLYFMFTAGILKGTFFPNIYTPQGHYEIATEKAKDPKDAGRTSLDNNANLLLLKTTTPNTNTANVNANSRQIANSSPNSNSTSNAGAGPSEPTETGVQTLPSSAETQAPGPKGTPTPGPTPEPKPVVVPTQGLTIFVFFAKSGPFNGSDYALLIIWCFIAGFAERFVPDALDRLIATSNSNGKK